MNFYNPVSAQNVCALIALLALPKRKQHLRHQPPQRINQPVNEAAVFCAAHLLNGQQRHTNKIGLIPSDIPLLHQPF